MTIEQIRSKVEETQTQIEKSNELTPEQKVEKARELESTLSQIKSDLDSLRDVTQDQEVIKAIDDLESEYETLNSNFETKFQKELADLQEEVVENGEGEPEIVPSENDKPNRWQRNKKTVLIGAGTLGVGLLIRRWIKKRRERKEGGGDNKKGFRNRGIGKVLKWTGIGVAGFFGIKWLLDKLKKGEPLDETQEQYDTYLDFMKENPEDYKQYEQMGTEVNKFYDNAWKTEKETFGFESGNELGSIGEELERREGYEHVEAKGMVPFCLDNYYSNVDEMISAGGVRKYMRQKNIEGYKANIRSFGADWFNRALVPFLSTFASFSSFGIISSDSAEEKMSKYFDKIGENAKLHEAQLDIFFRQYSKILTYTADKKNALAMQYAKPIIISQGYNGENRPSNLEDQQEILLEAINDKSWVKENLEGTLYGTFLKSKILGASKILESKGLLDSNITFELQTIIDDLDQESEDILGGLESNALFDAEAKLINGETIDTNTKNGLGKICDNIVEDMGDKQEGSWMYNTFDYLFEAFDLEQQDIQNILEQSGMNESFDATKASISQLKAEILTNPSKENVQKLKDLTGKYLAMKKELHLAVYAMQEARENKDFADHMANVINTIGAFYKKFFSSIKDIFGLKFTASGLINFFLGCTVTGGALVLIGRITGKNILTIPGKALTKVGLFPLSLTKFGMRMSGNSWAIRNRIINLANDGNERRATNLLKKSIANGKISPTDAVRAAKKIPGLKPIVNGNSGDNFVELCKKVVKNDNGELFAKFYKRNRKFAGKFTETTKIRNSRLDPRIHNIDGVFAKNNIAELKKLDLSLSELKEGSQSSKYFNKSLSRIKNADDIKLVDDLCKNQDFIKKINSLSPGELKRLRRFSFDEIRSLKKAGSFDKFVKGTKNIDNLVSTLGKNKKLVQSVSNVEHLDAHLKINFNNIINKEIGILENNIKIVGRQDKIARLTELKKGKNLTNADLETFIKLSDNKIRAQHFPDVGDWLKNEKRGNSLKKALSEGNYEDFKGILKNNKQVFKNYANIDVVVKHFDDAFEVFKRGGKYLDEVADLLKGLGRVMKLF
ncbi:MAG TPA: hypothetical protein P5060_01535 [Candidatus Absconditabacterales bacterium]|nr:hypothetical protein [Candidatus Absconditabacterales bacterium]